MQPLPQAVITAHKLREEARRLMLLADELEASVASQDHGKPVVFAYGEVKPKKHSGATQPSNNR